MCLVSQITHDHDESVQIMKKRVLMLGWEYPPIINGGLGIACQGLARALCSHVELTLYLPVSANQRDGQIKLIDLERHSNNLNEQLQTLSNIIQIPADLPPTNKKLTELPLIKTNSMDQTFEKRYFATPNKRPHLPRITIST